MRKNTLFVTTAFTGLFLSGAVGFAADTAATEEIPTEVVVVPARAVSRAL